MSIQTKIEGNRYQTGCFEVRMTDSSVWGGVNNSLHSNV